MPLACDVSSASLGLFISLPTAQRDFSSPKAARCRPPCSERHSSIASYMIVSQVNLDGTSKMEESPNSSVSPIWSCQVRLRCFSRRAVSTPCSDDVQAQHPTVGTVQVTGAVLYRAI